MYKLEKILECWIKGRPSRYLEWKNRVIEAVKEKLPENYSPPSAVSLRLDFTLEHCETNDIDNLVKPMMDALKVSGLFKDDTAVYHLEATKDRESEEGVKVQVWGWAIGLERLGIKRKSNVPEP
jgi:Holliday junction resolvase RusA-like endonuclease